MLEICPMTLKEANAYVEQYHRHHKPVVSEETEEALEAMKDGDKESV